MAERISIRSLSSAVTEDARAIPSRFCLFPEFEVRRFAGRISSFIQPRDGRHIMARVAREMVVNAGVNVDQLLELLVKNAAAELTTFY